MIQCEDAHGLNHEALLALLSLTDSALATGTFAHSFGLESLVTHGGVTTSNLAEFVATWLDQQVAFDASFCLQAQRIVTRHMQADETSVFAQLQRLNQTLDAFKLSRESRNASIRTGSRLLRLVATVYRGEKYHALLTNPATRESHQTIAFGIACALFHIDEAAGVLSILQQNTTSMISAAQRLLPLGQMRAAEMNWNLKPLLAAKAQAILTRRFDEVVAEGTFSPQLETLSMTHPYQGVRLFLS